MEHWQFISLCLIVYDAAAIAFSYLFALLLRFDFQFSQIPKEYYAGYRKFMPFYIMIRSPKVGKSRLRQLNNACSLTTEYSL